MNRLYSFFCCIFMLVLSHCYGIPVDQGLRPEIQELSKAPERAKSSVWLSKRVIGLFGALVVGSLVGMHILGSRKDEKKLMQDTFRKEAEKHITYLTDIPAQQGQTCGIYVMVVARMLHEAFKENNNIITDEIITSVQEKMKNEAQSLVNSIKNELGAERMDEDMITNYIKDQGIDNFVFVHDDSLRREFFESGRTVLNMPFLPLSDVRMKNKKMFYEETRPGRIDLEFPESILKFREGKPSFIVVNSGYSSHWYLIVVAHDEDRNVKVVVMDSLIPSQLKTLKSEQAHIVYRLYTEEFEEDLCRYFLIRSNYKDMSLALKYGSLNDLVNIVFYDVKSRRRNRSLLRAFIDGSKPLFEKWIFVDSSWPIDLVPLIKDEHNVFSPDVSKAERETFKFDKDDTFVTFFSRVLKNKKVKDYIEQRIKQENIGISYDQFKQRFQELFGDEPI